MRNAERALPGRRLATAVLVCTIVAAGCTGTRAVSITSDRPARILLDGDERCSRTPCEVELADHKEATLRAEPLEGDERPIELRVAAGVQTWPFAAFACCAMPPASFLTGLVGLALSPGALATPGLALCWVPGSVALLCMAGVWPIIGISVALIGASTHLQLLRIDFARREVFTSPAGHPVALAGGEGDGGGPATQASPGATTF